MKIKLNIAQKLIAGFSLILLVIILNGIFTGVTLKKSQSLSEEITGVYSPSEQKVQQFKDMVISSKALIKSWVFIDRQPGTADKIVLEKLHAEDYPKLIEELNEIKQNWKQEDQDSFDAIKLSADSLFTKHQYVMSSLNSFEAYDDVMVIFEVEPMVQEDGEIITMSNKIINELEVFVTKFANRNTSYLKEMDSSFSMLNWVVVIMMVVLLVVSVGIAYILYSGIVQPLTKGVAFAQSIGDGDLTAELEVEQDDEIGKLAEALKAMASNIKSTVIAIKENANDLVSSGKSVKDSSLQLSKGSADQAASAEEVSTSIEEMVANIDQNTDNAVQTEKITEWKQPKT